MNFKRTLAPLHASSQTMNDIDTHRRKQTISRRFRLPLFLLFVFLFALCFWSFLPSTESTAQYQYTDDVHHGTMIQNHLDTPTWDPQILTGPPTRHFRGALRSDVKYITSWPAAGWTNDVMTMFNLIYLGVITERVPILPPFAPSHVLADGATPEIDFGEVFDIRRMRELMKYPILEWRDVKNVETGLIDELGCWNVWESSQFREAIPRQSPTPENLHLDVSYTKTPSWVKLLPDEGDPHTTFWSLARLGYPDARNNNLVPPRPSPRNVSISPDEQLLCFDYLYYVAAHQPYEYEHDYSPAWRFVGQYAHFTPALKTLADNYVNRAIGIDLRKRTPPYISVHVRHSDFGQACGELSKKDCFAPLSAIARRVQEVKDELMEQKGVNVTHVVITSDEKDTEWWREVAELGWVIPDHTKTRLIYGNWYPVLIDAAIQSGGHGFVGTTASTMSLIAGRRVAAWQNGAVRHVKWGHPGADDH